jgi:hypothetical protein
MGGGDVFFTKPSVVAQKNRRTLRSLPDRIRRHSSSWNFDFEVSTGSHSG